MSRTTEPAWVTFLADQRLARILYALGGHLPPPDQYEVVMNPLTEPDEDTDWERWERTCDNCGTFCPEGEDFYAGVTSREHEGQQVIFTFGACAACAGA